jgi:hypothetical protein
MAASPTERSLCVLEFVAVQRAFRWQFGRRGSPETSIQRWYEQFRYRGCICHQVLQNTPIIYTHPVHSVCNFALKSMTTIRYLAVTADKFNAHECKL